MSVEGFSRLNSTLAESSLGFKRRCHHTQDNEGMSGNIRERTAEVCKRCTPLTESDLDWNSPEKIISPLMMNVSFCQFMKMKTF